MLERTCVISTLLLLATVSGACEAKSLGEYVDDARDYSTAPLRWDRNDWELAGLAAAATVATYTQDERVRSHFADAAPKATGDPNSLRDFAPLALLTAGTWAVGQIWGDDGLKHTGADMVEALALSSASTFVLKHAVGRNRPDATNDRDTWHTGGVSFPSGHTSAAFAAAQVFADSRPEGEWGWRAVAYGTGALTAFARVHDNMHWASDAVAGAALGLATGRFVSNRGSDGHGARRVGLSLEPLPQGALLSFSIDPFAE